jgi:thiamine-monophosphate kinase
VAVSEFELIRRIAGIVGTAREGVTVGIGDDAAVLPPDLVWTCDLLVEDVHFRRHTTSFDDLGWKALAVNVSDVAAMGAVPLGALVGLVVGEGVSAEDVEELYRGLAACATAYGCPVVGGDVSRGPDLSLAVTALGRTPTPVLRSGAGAGDVLAVTGPLGGSGAGWHLLEGRAALPADVAAHVAARHRRPRPRLAESRTLAASVHAMLDVSDGIASDALRLAESSGLAVVVDLDALPLDRGVAEVAAALGLEPGVLAATGGEDYELLVALDPADVARAGVPLHVVGRVEAGPVGVRFTGAGAADALGGWDHLGA